jgi:hypothetical protein
VDTYGVPLDTRYNYMKSDWKMFTAAAAGQSTQQVFISDLAKWTNETPANEASADGRVSPFYPFYLEWGWRGCITDVFE